MIELLSFIHDLPEFIVIDGCLIPFEVIYHIFFMRVFHIIRLIMQGIILYCIELEVSLMIN